MDKNVYSIEEIFAGRIFSIPDYQRGYAWEKEHCLDLLDDLDQLPPGFNHYTGTVVFHAKGEELLDNEGSKYQGFDIVDGQQRLTSLVILLDSVHRSFSGLTGYDTLASGIEKKYIKGIRLVDKTPFQKLTLNADCSNYFRTDFRGRGDYRSQDSVPQTSSCCKGDVRRISFGKKNCARRGIC